MHPASSFQHISPTPFLRTCAASLEGEVGLQVSCAIYLQRPSTCREFDVLDVDGQPNFHCFTLRIRIGLTGVDFPL
jgi:hypothetical protein